LFPTLKLLIFAKCPITLVASFKEAFKKIVRFLIVQRLLSVVLYLSLSLSLLEEFAHLCQENDPFRQLHFLQHVPILKVLKSSTLDAFRRQIRKLFPLEFDSGQPEKCQLFPLYVYSDHIV
jgi:hypothetical protein